jgi:hypothetical protein
MVRYFLYFALLWLPFGPGQIAFSQSTPVEPVGEQTGDRSSHFDAAYHMASLSVGGTTLSSAIKESMREQLLDGFKQDADFQELELEFPGIAAAMVDAALPVAVRQTEETMPALIESLATVFAEGMTAEEIAVATKWFLSPAFSRINAQMESNMDISKIIDDALADAESQISSEDLQTIGADSAARSASAMALEDRAAMMRFSGTSAFAKIEALKPRTQAIEAAWTNDENPDHDVEMENIMLKAMKEFSGLDLSE